MELIILQGLPASGKTTYARALQRRNPKHSVIVSRDEIRHARGVYWIPEQEDYITAIEEFEVTAALSRAYNVILDATNLNKTYLAKWEQIASKYGATVRYVKFTTPVEECVKRDRNPDRKHQVGAEVIRQFHDKYKDVLKYKSE